MATSTLSAAAMWPVASGFFHSTRRRLTGPFSLNGSRNWGGGLLAPGEAEGVGAVVVGCGPVFPDRQAGGGRHDGAAGNERGVQEEAAEGGDGGRGGDAEGGNAGLGVDAGDVGGGLAWAP